MFDVSRKHEIGLKPILPALWVVLATTGVGSVVGQDTLRTSAETRNPHGPIAIACDACHSTGSWSNILRNPAFDHNAETSFLLEGQHEAGKCTACHTDLSFKGTSGECYACHNDVHKGQLGNQCEKCHTSSSWRPFRFQHSLTRFPLLGRHSTTDCQSCHQNQKENEFAGLSTECISCHAADYQSSVNPNHLTNNMGTDCQTCHHPVAWTTTIIRDHNGFGFPLVLAHASVDCKGCHAGGEFANTAARCVSCHESAYTTTTDPDHVAGNFSVECEECHTTQPGWTPAVFDHGLTTFPLTGAHLAVQNQCILCHSGGFSNTPTDCYACHQTNYQSTTNPNHVASGFPTTCAVCHSTGPGWTPAVFNHDLTAFPLTGAHAAIPDCQQCHAGGYTGTPTACYACHQNDYTAAVDPNHVTSGFPTACETCHSTQPGWSPASFDHSATQFPLTGAHLAVQNQCILCHSGGFSNTPTECYACHESDYTASANPAHAALSFPTGCENCHQTSAWVPSTFDHGQYTGYTLQGAHQAIANQCASCHEGNLTGASADCYSCHDDDYAATTNPGHVGSGFSQQCETCHSQNAWVPWTVNHDILYFPVSTGKHRNKWTGCGGGSGDGAGCHTVSSNYQIYSCIHCHEHSQTEMDNEHDEVSGYQYASTACFACHPDGEAPLAVRKKPIRVH